MQCGNNIKKGKQSRAMGPERKKIERPGGDRHHQREK